MCSACVCGDDAVPCRQRVVRWLGRRQRAIDPAWDTQGEEVCPETAGGDGE